MPQTVRWLWLTLALLGLGWLAWQLLSVVLLVAIALLLTAALVPLVSWLDEHGLPHWLSVTLCFVGLVGLVMGVMAYAVPLLARQAQQMAVSVGDLSARYNWLQQHWGAWREEWGLIPKFSDITAFVKAHTASAVERVIGLTGQFLGVAFGTFSVMFLAFLFLSDGSKLREQLLSLVPPPHRDDTRDVFERITQRVGRYVLGQAINMVFVGTLAGLGLWLLGVPYPALLGLLIGLFDIVPVVGPFVAATPGVLLALGQSWETALWAILIYVAVEQIEGYVTYPNIVGRAIRLHPAWIFLGFLAGAQLLGLAGMVLAIPVMVVLQIVMEEWYLPWVAKHRIRPTLVTPSKPASIRYTGKAWETGRPGAESSKRPPGSGKAV